MRILHARPVTEPETKGTRCIGTIDIELNPDVRLYGLRLLHMADGKILLFAPNAGRRRSATFSPGLAATLTAMAKEALERVPANDA